MSKLGRIKTTVHPAQIANITVRIANTCVRVVQERKISDSPNNRLGLDCEENERQENETSYA